MSTLKAFALRQQQAPEVLIEVAPAPAPVQVLQEEPAVMEVDTPPVAPAPVAVSAPNPFAPK